jgi:hypothetical protein
LQLICDRKHHVASPGLCSSSDVAIARLGLKMDAEETSVLWLDRNAEEQAFEARPGCAR